MRKINCLSQYKVTGQGILYTNHRPWNLHIDKIKWWTHKAQIVVRFFTLWFVWIWMLNMFHFVIVLHRKYDINVGPGRGDLKSSTNLSKGGAQFVV